MQYNNPDLNETPLRHAIDAALRVEKLYDERELFTSEESFQRHFLREATLGSLWAGIATAAAAAGNADLVVGDLLPKDYAMSIDMEPFDEDDLALIEELNKANQSE